MYRLNIELNLSTKGEGRYDYNTRGQMSMSIEFDPNDPNFNADQIGLAVTRRITQLVMDAEEFSGLAITTNS